MRQHERSVRGAGPSTYTPPPDCRYTQRGNRLYLHLMSWPMRHVHLPGLQGKVEYAQFLHDASDVRWLPPPLEEAHNTDVAGVPSGSLSLELPVQRPDVALPVIELFLRE
jgi:alpha-L-fucosidase